MSASARLDEVERLVADLEREADPVALARARALVRAVLDLHADGLARILARLEADGATDLIGDLAADPLVSSLLILHGVHPDPVEVRARRALEGIAADLARRGGGAALVGAGDGEVRVRLEALGGAANGEPLRALVEAALAEAVPDAASVEIDARFVEGSREGFIPIDRIGAIPAAARTGPVR